MREGSTIKPLVSIGLPVYNEQRFIRETVASLLAQDFEDLELIISDNASTDGTEEICRQFAAQDPRVSYERSEVNRGAFVNFDRVFELASAKYFMWAGAHDLWSPSFISRAVGMLEADSQLVLAYPRPITIDTTGKELGAVDDHFAMPSGSDLERYLYLIWHLQSCNMFHGLMRRQALPPAGLRHVWGADIILLAGLALRGDIAEVADEFFYRRIIRPDEEHDDAWKKRALETVEGPRPSKRHEMSLEKLFREMRNEQMRMVWNSHLSFRNKMRALAETIKCARIRFGVMLPADTFLRGLLRLRKPKSFIKRLRGRTNPAGNT